MQLSDIMQLGNLDKQQLVELCNALYDLLQQRQAQVPAFTFIPGQPIPQPAPYVPYYPYPPTITGVEPPWKDTLIGINAVDPI